jgi:hypothetical protein
LEPPPELALPLDADPLEEADWPELAPGDPLEDPAPEDPFDGPELEPLVDALEEAEEVPELVPVPSLGDPEPPPEFVPQAEATAMSTAAMAFGLRILVMGLFISGRSSEDRLASPTQWCRPRRSVISSSKTGSSDLGQPQTCRAAGRISRVGVSFRRLQCGRRSGSVREADFAR